METLQFSSLAAVPGLRHAVTARDGGISGGEFSSLNLAFHVNDVDEAVCMNRSSLARYLGYNDKVLIGAEQVHGDHVHVVTKDDDPEYFVPQTDALVTQEKDIPLLILVADCAPILLVDPENNVLAVVHAGWKGALARIASKTVMQMAASFGSRSESILVGIGPCLSIENLEVGQEVADEVLKVDAEAIVFGWDKPHLDLRGLIQRDLQGVGIQSENIETMPFCTRDDDRFFSHRGQSGKAGRFGIVAWWDVGEHRNQDELNAQVRRLALEIPSGRVISYGALGKRCNPPISGYICGRVMSQILDGVPWWRIVGKDGALPISKRSPHHALKQRDLLAEEGIEFDENGKVQRRFFEDDQQTLF